MTIINELTKVISCALKGTTYKGKIENEREVLTMAQENGMLPLLLKGLEEGVLNENNYKRLQDRVLNYVHLDRIQHVVIDKVNETFNKNNIEHLFVKGTHIKNLYPETYLRPMGDCDVLIKKENSLKSRKIMKEAGFITTSRSGAHDVYEYQKNSVEVHRYIYQKENKKDNSILNNPWDNAVLVENSKYRLDYSFEAVYILYHLKKHVLSSGIGLRSILDITIFYNHYEKEIDLEFLNKELKKNNLDEFLQAILYVNKKFFDLDSPFLKEDYKLEEKDLENIIKYITSSGVHGKGQDFNVMAPRLVKRSKLRTFLSVVFPSWTNMKEAYSWLRYLPFLLPVAYVIRGFKFLFLKTKYSFGKVKKIRKADNEITELDDIFNKMGL